MESGSLRALTDRIASAAVNRAWSWVVRHGRIGPEDSRARAFGTFGKGTCLAFPPGSIYGERWIHLGQDTLIGPNVCLTAGMAPGQQMISDPVVAIGDRCVIGRGSHIIGHFSIELGDDIFTGPYVYITDQNHRYEDLDVPVGRQWPRDAPVSIGSGSWLGTNVTVLPGSTIGKHVVVATGSVVMGTYPDRCVIAGAPARIVRHFEPGRGWVRSSTEKNLLIEPTP